MVVNTLMCLQHAFSFHQPFHDLGLERATVGFCGWITEIVLSPAAPIVSLLVFFRSKAWLSNVCLLSMVSTVFNSSY